MPNESPFQAESAEVVLHKVRLPFGLEVDEVRLNGEGLVVHPKPFAYDAAGPASFEATLTDLAIQAFLEKKSPDNVRDFFVQLSEGKVHVHATARVIIEVRAVAICFLEIVEEKQVFVRLEKVDVLGVGAKGLVQKQLDELNPVLDVRDFPADIRLESTEVAQGKLILRGTIKPL